MLKKALRRIAPALGGGILVIVIIALGLWWGSGGEAAALEPLPPSEADALQPQATTQVNLLANGSMDEGPFYFRPPNHYVADKWFEWWVDPKLPEFINGGSIHHNICYPYPTGGQTCKDVKNKSQGYIRWGAPFIAGIYQPVAVTPCLYYRFEAYNRNDDTTYHPKVGIEPAGWQPPPKKNPVLPHNCPPDGHTECPDPSFHSVDDIPSTIVWSPEFDHDAFTWASQSLVAEALSTTITVWTYAAPEGTSKSMSAYWDQASLVYEPHPDNLLVPLDGVLAPDGGIEGVTSSTFLGSATFRWQTPELAFSQVLYHYVGPVTSPELPPIITNTAHFEAKTDIDLTLRAAHSFKLQNLLMGAVYDVALLSRRWMGSQCQTSVYLTRIQTSDMLVPVGPLPAPDGGISNVEVITTFNRAILRWQTSDPAYSQVLYHYVGQASSTALPPMVNDTRQFELKTGVSPVTRTLHSIDLIDLLPLSVYDVALLSCHPLNDQCQVSVYRMRIETSDLIVPAGALPVPDNEISNATVLPFERSAYIIWQSAHPAYSQVLYGYRGPVTPTLTFTPTSYIYLPLVSATRTGSGATSDYEFRTWPDTSLTTLHIVELTGLITDSRYLAVAVSAWEEDGQYKMAASDRIMFRTKYKPVLAIDNIRPDQLLEPLQICLEGGEKLEACLDELVSARKP